MKCIRFPFPVFTLFIVYIACALSARSTTVNLNSIFCFFSHHKQIYQNNNNQNMIIMSAIPLKSNSLKSIINHVKQCGNILLIIIICSIPNMFILNINAITSSYTNTQQCAWMICIYYVICIKQETAVPLTAASIHPLAITIIFFRSGLVYLSSLIHHMIMEGFSIKNQNSTRQS